MSENCDRLYELLPAFHRWRDTEQGYPLRDLLRVVTEQVDVVEADIKQLYENWFVETCQDWVVPYIGDLIGYRPVREAGEPGDVNTLQGQQRNKILIPRREVANTIRYRRRKGTLALLELLANDVAGWSARVVEFYQLLGWTQHLNHLRPTQGRTVDLRQGDALDLLDRPFDQIAHTVDVRRIQSPFDLGRYNLPDIGVFVWRLKSYSVTKIPAYCLEEIGPHCFTFSVLGNDAPLYIHPQPEPVSTHIAEELNVPTPIRRRALETDLEELKKKLKENPSGLYESQYYGENQSLQIWVGRSGTGMQPIPAEQIIVADLSQWQYRTPVNMVAVDPVLGRIAFSPRQPPRGGVWVYYHYGFSADMGGGEYDRSLLQPPEHLLLDIYDLKNQLNFVNRIKDNSLLSQYLRSQFSSSTQERLASYNSSSPPSDQLQAKLLDELLESLLQDLNQSIERSSLYDDRRFAGITLSAETQRLATQHLEGINLTRLNRLLLEEFYKEEIARHYVLYRVDRQMRLADALGRWSSEKPRYAIIEITDSGVYTERFDLTLNPHQSLQIRAANRTRPVIRLLDYQADAADAMRIALQPGSQFALDGLLIIGRGVQILGEMPEETKQPSSTERCHIDTSVRVNIRHSTLVPGWTLHCDCEPKRPAEPSLEILNFNGRIEIERTIIGSIQVNQDEVQSEPLPIAIRDSILDATSSELEALDAPGCPVAHARLTILRSTVLGKVMVHAIDLAENTIFNDLVTTARRQQGCVRFCYVAPRSRTPRRYNCQPDLVEAAITQQLKDAAVADGKTQTMDADGKTQTMDAELKSARGRERDRVRPQFNSIRYSTPTYCQLSRTCAEEIKRGADDESEIGAFHDLYQPQRDANLRARLDEYTPAGMETGIIYAS